MKANAALMVVLLGAALAARLARYRPRLVDALAIVGIGLAESTGTTSPAQLLDAADAAMYGRKAGEPRPGPGL